MQHLALFMDMFSHVLTKGVENSDDEMPAHEADSLDITRLAMTISTEGDPSSELDDPGFNIFEDMTLLKSANKYTG
jgi:hypothetical protein